MAGVRTLAEGRMKWGLGAVKPVSATAVKLTEVATYKNVGDRATATGTFIRSTGSDKTDTTDFNGTSKRQSLGPSNFAGQIEPYMYLDPVTGKADVTDNEIYDLVRVKGTVLYVMERRGPKEPTAWAVGDSYTLYAVTCDERAQPDQTGELRDVVPFSVTKLGEGTLVA